MHFTINFEKLLKLMRECRLMPTCQFVFLPKRRFCHELKK